MKKELQLAVDWEVGPYYNEVLDNGGSMPSIGSMVATVRGELSAHRYTEGGKYPLATWRSVPSVEEVYDAVAAEYYPHLQLEEVPEMLVWREQELVLRFNNFDRALEAFYGLDPYHYIVTIDNVPMFMREAISVVYEMKHSGHYKE